jgi:co-chaperonin GroES (HSP10)
MSDNESIDGDADLDAPERPLRHINPMGLRVVVRLDPDEERSPSGLYLPQGVGTKDQQALYGEVIEVARATADDEHELGSNVSGVPLGAKVLIPKESGIEVPWDNTLRLVETKDILCCVEEYQADEVN